MKNHGNTLYTFEDWVNDKFCFEKDFLNIPVLNDSENYLTLAMMGKMTFDTVNKIQEQQALVYEYIIKCSLEWNEKNLTRQTKESLDLKEYLRLSIKKLEQFFAENENLYLDILRPKKHRGIKYGAKFITSEQYQDFLNNKRLDAYIPSFSKYSFLIDGEYEHFPTSEQMKYAGMEVNILWKKRLEVAQETLLSEKQAPSNIIALKSVSELKNQSIEQGFSITVASNPTFIPEQIDNLFTLLKDFFNKDQQSQLKRLLETSENDGEPLIFLDNGNRLANTFKQLFENDFITGCQKQELEKWIIRNFRYRYRNNIKEFTLDYIEKCISRNDNPCKNPLIEIKEGLIKKAAIQKRKTGYKY